MTESEWLAATDPTLTLTRRRPLQANIRRVSLRGCAAHHDEGSDASDMQRLNLIRDAFNPEEEFSRGSRRRVATYSR